jgi:hypothetical protein
LHGGLTPAGTASPHFKHGRRSRYLRDLPKELRKDFIRASNDSDLISLREEILLRAVRTNQLLRELSKTQAPPWGTVVEKFNDCKLRLGQEGFTEKFAELETTIGQGQGAANKQEKTWQELRALGQDKARLTATEQKRLIDLKGTMPVEEAAFIVRQWIIGTAEVVKASLSPAEANAMLQEIQAKTRSLLPPPDED